LVKPAAHDSLDGCSNRPSLKYETKGKKYIFLFPFPLGPSAGIGRQDNLKIY
jgi:hypothetical protein